MNKPLAIKHLYPNADPLNDFSVQYDGKFPQMLNGAPRPTYKDTIEGSGYEELAEEDWIEGAHYTLELVPWEDLILGTDYEMIDTEPYISKWAVKDATGKVVSQPRETELQAAWDEMTSPSTKLKEAKHNKIIELNQACMKDILGRFPSTVDGVIYEFSYDHEAQSNFNGSANALSRGYMTQVEWTAYDSTGKAIRILLNELKFDGVAKDALVHVNSKISRFRNDLLPQVEIATTLTEVEAVVW